MSTKLSTLIIAPHADDEVLGCGGILYRYRESTDVVIVSERSYPNKPDRDRQVKNSRKVLNYRWLYTWNLPDELLDNNIAAIAKSIEDLLNTNAYTDVYIPFWGDNNQDHRAVFDSCSIALRRFSNDTIKRVFCYEVPSSTEQALSYSRTPFKPTAFVSLSKNEVSIKIKAFNQYKSETRQSPHPRSTKKLKALMSVRGSECNSEYAEAFIPLYLKYD